MAETSRLRGMERAIVIHSEDGLEQSVPPSQPRLGLEVMLATGPERSLSPTDSACPRTRSPMSSVATPPTTPA